MNTSSTSSIWRWGSDLGATSPFRPSWINPRALVVKTDPHAPPYRTMVPKRPSASKDSHSRGHTATDEYKQGLQPYSQRSRSHSSGRQYNHQSESGDSYYCPTSQHSSRLRQYCQLLQVIRPQLKFIESASKIHRIRTLSAVLLILHACIPLILVLLQLSTYSR